MDAADGNLLLARMFGKCRERKGMIMTAKESGSVDDGAKARIFSAEDARGGEIILRTKTRRVIFIAGLAGCVLLGLVVHALT